jgi:hypothetical protein
MGYYGHWGKTYIAIFKNEHRTIKNKIEILSGMP